jgi:hypothetical protein
MIYYIVYKTTNKINNKIYIGFHKTKDLNDSYLGSGSLLLKAIEKYGKENFSREILKIFDTKEEAEKYEQELVNKEFTLREDTYNVVIGGNVRIAYGENNGFYKKTHTNETKKKISEKNLNNKSSLRYPITNDIILFNSYDELVNHLNISGNIRHKILLLCGGESEYYFVDTEKQNQAKEYYINWKERKKRHSELLAESAKKRFTNYVWSAERNKKLSESLKGKKRKQEHIDKINKNPEKIRKTAEKHRGMKRSEESKLKMSLAKKGKPASNLGKRLVVNLEGKRVQYDKDKPLPDGWRLVIRKWAIDNNGNKKLFDTYFELPEGWTWKY